MLLDKLTEFALAQDVFGVAGTANLSNQIDLGAIGRDVGQSFENAQLVIVVTTAFVGGTSTQFQIASDSSAAIATAGSQTVHGATQAFTPGELVVGRKIVLPLPPGGDVSPYEQFLGVQVVRVGTSTAGAVTAAITHDGGHWKAYADAVN